MHIPGYKPFMSGREKEYILDALQRGHLSGDGYYTKKVAAFMEKYFGAAKVLLTTSGTHALEMAAVLADLQPGDEVIMPSFTFSSTANAVLARGAKPVFAEINPEDLNIDPDDIERKITARTKALIPVHYAGVACEMDRIMAIAGENNLQVIEDAAQGVNAKYRGRYLGTIGDFGCFSFHGTKNYTCGEGGALLLNGSRAQLEEKAEIIRQKGTNRFRFLQGEVDKYTWVAAGSSYTPSELLMAVLLAQLENMQKIREKRKALCHAYWEALAHYEQKGLIKMMSTPLERELNYHIFWILFDTEEKRDYTLKELKSRGVEASFHFLPLHISPMGRKLGCRPGDLPVTEKAAGCLLRLPLYAGMTETELEYTVQNIKSVLGAL